MEYMRAYRDLSAGDDLVFVASTPGVKSDGLAIDQDRWDLSRYNDANPVFLWAHDYQSMPLGKAAAWVEGGKLRARVDKWASTDFAREVEQAYRDGILNAVSVGWEDVDEDGKPIRRGQTPARHILLDISAVPVPGDPDALIERKRRAWAELSREMLRLATTDTADEGVSLPGDGTHVTDTRDMEGENMEDEQEGATRGEDSWASIAAAMVGVFDRESDDSDDERQRAYKALLPKYRRQGVEPPEFLEAAQVRAMDDETWANLFLSGELDAASWIGVRVGAVLNARNKKLLQDAAGNIESVLRSAEGSNAEPAAKEAAHDEPEQRAADEPEDGTDDVTDPDTLPSEGEPPPPVESDEHDDDDPLALLRGWRDALTEAEDV